MVIKELKDYTTFEKSIFGLGWLNVLSGLFWCVVFFIAVTDSDKRRFWSARVLRFVYYTGYWTIVKVLFLLILLLEL